ncbi:flagellar export chaperone FliS [uncultured Desulfobulbus sp.]|uniref:flagellar export chaperone FliS n=1 Tax=uncultured Desulfobulbus sp. TaxID=239745 RepID=UPI0029C7923D|nr:flagellar export chaperone FliS [uncultured Desulfobulbus sp.]
MNMYSNDYLRTQISTASKEQLLLMFYDGAIRFTGRARMAIERGDIQDRNYCIKKANAVIAELDATLNHSIGGKIAEDLDSLYTYMLNELNLATIHNSTEPLIKVEEMLSGLRETWVQAIDIVKKEKQSAMFPAKSMERGSFSIAL